MGNFKNFTQNNSKTVTKETENTELDTETPIETTISPEIKQNVIDDLRII